MINKAIIKECILQSCNCAKRNEKIGVLLLNLGSPDNTSYLAVRRYLKEFLSDEKVIDLPRYKWWPILNLIILQVRPQKTAKAYKEIWDNEKNDSPLRIFTEKQVDKVTERFKTNYPNLIFDYAMRYGNPSTESKIKKFINKGCQKLLLIPMYPQYSNTTTATAVNKAMEVLKNTQFQPTVRVAEPYYKRKSYIKALAASIENHLKEINFKPEKIIASYHGVPLSYQEKGDPYPCQCRDTSRLIEKELGLKKNYLITSFQSLFGKAEWVKPYTEPTVANFARNGIKNISVISPAFSVDCLETLEEINGEIKDAFIQNGGENFSYIPCLNDSKASIDILEELIKDELKGWL